MLKTRVIPCLLLQDGGLVKTINFKNPTYIGDPLNAVRIFNELEVDELVFLDIRATNEKRLPDSLLIEAIATECFMPFSYGGGIRSIDTIRKLLRLGVEKVIINSYAIENPEFIREASSEFGSSTIVVSMDVKQVEHGDYSIYLNSGRVNTQLDPISYAQRLERNGAGEIFINSIDQDGMMMGYDLNLLKLIANSVSIPVVACGGAGKLEDLSKAEKQTGISAVAAGSMFVYYGRQKGILINYPNRSELERYLD